jgi:hypothetical protein
VFDKRVLRHFFVGSDGEPIEAVNRFEQIGHVQDVANTTAKLLLGRVLVHTNEQRFVHNGGTSWLTKCSSAAFLRT